MRRALLLGLLGAPGAVSFLLPSSPSTAPLPAHGSRSGSSGVALASSYYDEYDAQGARNMEQDRCVWYGVAWCWAGIGLEVGGVGSESEDGGTQLDGSIHTGQSAPYTNDTPIPPSTDTRRSNSRNSQIHRPDWAGGGLVSNLVSALIGNKFLYGLMKIGARKTLIDNAEKKGVMVRFLFIFGVCGGEGRCVYAF